jgi:hypothetical protein
MKIILYQRSFPVKDSPVALSLLPFSLDQRHTYTVGDQVYEAERKEVHVIVPDDAKIDSLKNLLSWSGEKGTVKSTANEVYELAKSGLSGFKTTKG